MATWAATTRLSRLSSIFGFIFPPPLAARGSVWILEFGRRPLLMGVCRVGGFEAAGGGAP